MRYRIAIDRTAKIWIYWSSENGSEANEISQALAEKRLRDGALLVSTSALWVTIGVDQLRCSICGYEKWDGKHGHPYGGKRTPPKTLWCTPVAN